MDCVGFRRKHPSVGWFSCVTRSLAGFGKQMFTPPTAATTRWKPMKFTFIMCWIGIPRFSWMVRTRSASLRADAALIRSKLFVPGMRT